MNFPHKNPNKNRRFSLITLMTSEWFISGSKNHGVLNNPDVYNWRLYFITLYMQLTKPGFGHFCEITWFQPLCQLCHSSNMCIKYTLNRRWFSRYTIAVKHQGKRRDISNGWLFVGGNWLKWSRWHIVLQDRKCIYKAKDVLRNLGKMFLSS